MDTTSRGQRDVEGEREARLRDIEQLEELIRRVDGEVATAETEKAQFQAAQRRTENLIDSHRYHCMHMYTCTHCVSLLPHSFLGVKNLLCKARYKHVVTN